MGDKRHHTQKDIKDDNLVDTTQLDGYEGMPYHNTLPC